MLSAADLKGSPSVKPSSIGPIDKDAARECVRETPPLEVVRTGPVFWEFTEALLCATAAPVAATAPVAAAAPEAPAAPVSCVISQPRYCAMAELAPVEGATLPASWVVLRVFENESLGEWLLDWEEVLSRWSA